MLTGRSSRAATAGPAPTAPTRYWPAALGAVLALIGLILAGGGAYLAALGREPGTMI
jgi:hypothetical protein